MKEVTTPTHGLFGGNFEATLPKGFIDVSNLRPIPDTQEIYYSPATRQTLIFDILVKFEEKELKKAAFHAYSDIVDIPKEKDDLKDEVTSVEVVPEDALTNLAREAYDDNLVNGHTNYHTEAVIVTAQQFFPNAEEDSKESTFVMALLRLPEICDTDITVYSTTPKNSSIENPTLLVRNIVETFRIKKWAIFGSIISAKRNNN